MNINHVLRKGGQAGLTLLLASVVIFFAVRALPGDPAVLLAGEDRSPEVIAAIRERFGLDRPLMEQYGLFLLNALRGDLGSSSRNGTPVTELIGATLPVTLQLAALAVVIAAVVGITAGSIAAYWKGRWQESVSSGLAILALSVPNFWVGMLGIMLFSIGLGWLPASGYIEFAADPGQWLRHLLMPAIVLGTGLAAVVMRQTRSSMIDALSSEYIVAARARGLREGTVVVRHALRNSLVVVTTIIGLQLGSLIAGVVITERLFGIPGFGKLMIDAISQRDYSIIQGVVLVTALAYVAINFLIDVLYTVLDPRVRVGGAS